MSIVKACVIGAGVMGSGIAAHIANAGVPVLLLDIVPPNATDRSSIAKTALERLAKADPAPLMSKSASKMITPGNIEDDLKQLADVDWIIEAVAERPDIKQGLYRKIESSRKPGSILSSNTSTLPMKMLMAGMPESIARDFCITHFFNPPRYMRLLEVVGGSATRPEVISAITAFADERLGKAVVKAKDTPGFIANRIGVFWIQAAVSAARELGLTVEEADAVMSRPIGAPKSGVFGLMDLVGLDLQPLVDASFRTALLKDDAYRAIPSDFPLLTKMIADGYTGRKGKGGFYRLNTAGGKRLKESISLKTGEYAASVAAKLESVDAAKAGLRALVTHKDRGGLFAWAVLSKMLAYAASLVPQIADDIVDVDRAMKAGFNWKHGPFEMIDALGCDWFMARLTADGIPVPPLLMAAVMKGGYYKSAESGPQQLGVDGSYKPVPRQSGALQLSDCKRGTKPLARNGSASVWDLGDGVACLEFHSKMNTLDPDSLAMVQQAVDIVGEGMRALVIHNEAENFSAGANIGLALFAANLAVWPTLDQLIVQGQSVMRALKYAKFPVVGAPSGMALGGGCEILLHCSAVQAHAETYMGLVEVGVGIIPAWGGCKEMLIRNQPGPHDPKGPMPAVMAAFEQISLAKVSKSAADAKEMKLLRKTDGITMNRDRLLADAKALALKMVADGYKSPDPIEFRLPGATARAALKLAVDGYALQGLAFPHDIIVAGHLANVLSGGDTDVMDTVDEDRVMKLEKRAFMALVKTEPTLARMEAMLADGKPLRN
ncbi:MAG: 3-hydroxyacyl-CoA dehydrogenase NAD-binding domain-containing protein [Aestuariivirga sp.]|nr:3-hydroxyacyl-CoA dehydrogenase NAD-binding domain-containing protein [Aestuariivirga sp.]